MQYIVNKIHKLLIIRGVLLNVVVFCVHMFICSCVICLSQEHIFGLN